MMKPTFFGDNSMFPVSFPRETLIALLRAVHMKSAQTLKNLNSACFLTSATLTNTDDVKSDNWFQKKYRQNPHLCEESHKGIPPFSKMHRH